METLLDQVTPHQILTRADGATTSCALAHPLDGGVLTEMWKPTRLPHMGSNLTMLLSRRATSQKRTRTSNLSTPLLTTLASLALLNSGA